MSRQVPGISLEQLRRDWPLIALIFLGFALGTYFYPQLPLEVPSHWNLAGEVNGYSSRFFGAFAMPLLSLVLYVMFLILPELDPKKTNYNHFAGIYNVVRWGVLALLFLIHMVVLLAGLGYTIDAGRVVQPAIALLFIAMGNQMGRVRLNYFVGLRTPWTLANEEVWRRTHRMAGPFFVGGGVVALLGTWLPVPYNFAVLMVAVVVTSLIPLGYSYVAFRRISPDS